MKIGKVPQRRQDNFISPQTQISISKIFLTNRQIISWWNNRHIKKENSPDKASVPNNNRNTPAQTGGRRFYSARDTRRFL